MSYHRVTLTALYWGQTIQNVVHVENVNGALTSEQIAGNFLNFWLPGVRPIQLTILRYFEIRVASIRNPNPPASFVLPVNLTGTGPSGESESAMAFKIRFGTGLAGRKHRGRYYIAGYSNSWLVAGGSISASGQTALQTFCNTIRDNWCVGGAQKIPNLTLVIDHKDPNVTPTPVTTVSFSSTLAVQRRRNLLVGI
jgi:hypothetical protein